MKFDELKECKMRNTFQTFLKNHVKILMEKLALDPFLDLSISLEQLFKDLYCLFLLYAQVEGMELY